ncbi:hypothetical protein BLNAU_22755 [Blattamonas nauphoetae]|uniref:Uncharacterized protein n=1 Tax=Blattamonas nauphoetae TaxID=2049346 RepID=A0ABQ9WS70_9EUKA|nr:hypothetical protein BLNAU_22755 [Blattamonas nauphoetae]
MRVADSKSLVVIETLHIHAPLCLFFTYPLLTDMLRIDTIAIRFTIFPAPPLDVTESLEWAHPTPSSELAFSLISATGGTLELPSVAAERFTLATTPLIVSSASVTITSSLFSSISLESDPLIVSSAPVTIADSSFSSITRLTGLGCVLEAQKSKNGQVQVIDISSSLALSTSDSVDTTPFSLIYIFHPCTDGTITVEEGEFQEDHHRCGNESAPYKTLDGGVLKTKHHHAQSKGIRSLNTHLLLSGASLEVDGRRGTGKLQQKGKGHFLPVCPSISAPFLRFLVAFRNSAGNKQAIDNQLSPFQISWCVDLGRMLSSSQAEVEMNLSYHVASSTDFVVCSAMSIHPYRKNTNSLLDSLSNTIEGELLDEEVDTPTTRQTVFELAMTPHTPLRRTTTHGFRRTSTEMAIDDQSRVFQVGVFSAVKTPLHLILTSSMTQRSRELEDQHLLVLEHFSPNHYDLSQSRTLSLIVWIFREGTEEARKEEGTEEARKEERTEEARKEEGTEEGWKEEGTEEARKEEGTEEARKEDGTEEPSKAERTEDVNKEEGTEDVSKAEGTEEARKEEGTEEARKEEGTEEARKEEGTEEARKEEGAEEARKEEGAGTTISHQAFHLYLIKF